MDRNDLSRLFLLAAACAFKQTTAATPTGASLLAGDTPRVEVFGVQPLERLATEPASDHELTAFDRRLLAGGGSSC